MCFRCLQKSVIYKHVVARKIRLTRRFNLILFIEINKINKPMEYLNQLKGCYLVSSKWLLWSGPAAVDSIACVTSTCPIYIFLTSNTCPRKHYLWKKNDWLKNRPFFITENFLGILNRIYTEPMHRSHDFLSLTLAVFGSISSRCYFIQQCQCLSVCVLYVLVVRLVKS